jgi:hypothetical protein
MLLHPPASLCEVEAAHVLVIGEQAGQRASHLAHLYAQWHVNTRTIENRHCGLYLGADNQGGG